MKGEGIGMNNVGVVIVAAGSSRRMGNTDKQTIMLLDIPVIVWAIEPFQRMNQVKEIVLVTRKENMLLFENYVKEWRFDKVRVICEGADTRQQSVINGVEKLESHVDYIAIHDGARPFIDEDIINRCLEDAIKYGASTASVKTKDTIKISEAGFIQSTPNRDNLYLTQTPQIFEWELYHKAIATAIIGGMDFTDDCQLVENLGQKVYLSQGSYDNIKITTPEDLIIAKAIAKQRRQQRENTKRRAVKGIFKIGHGYDVHRLVEDRKLILGGVHIPYEKGLLGHSDADVLVHAVMDALLGAAAMGDIGKYFPDTDNKYCGANSIELLSKTHEIVKKEGFSIGNIDATILAQRPKLSPFIEQMRENIAIACGIEISRVSIKATTEEGLGFTGVGEGIAAHSVCLIEG